MGRGYTSYNVWPNQKPNATDLEFKPKVSAEKDDEKEARTAEAIVKILEPLIASLVKLKEPEKKDQPDSAKQREKYFSIWPLGILLILVRIMVSKFCRKTFKNNLQTKTGETIRKKKVFVL